MSNVTVTSGLDSRANLSNSMNTIGTFTFTTDAPIRLQGFGDGTAISWAQDTRIQKPIKDEIEDRFDVFSDDTYPYEDYYKYGEAGFLQGIKEAKFVYKTVAALSALDRLNLAQDIKRLPLRILMH